MSTGVIGEKQEKQQLNFTLLGHVLALKRIIPVCWVCFLKNCHSFSEASAIK